MASTVLPEVRASADALLQAIDVSDEDTVIEVARFYLAQDPTPSPELMSVT
jgi:hypothetical protein